MPIHMLPISVMGAFEIAPNIIPTGRRLSAAVTLRSFAMKLSEALAICLSGQISLSSILITALRGALVHH